MVPSRAACPPPRAQAAPALCLGAGSRRREGAQGRDPSSRPASDPERAGIKPGRRRVGTRVGEPPERGEAGPGPSGCPRPCPSDRAPGAGLPARRHKAVGAQRRYLQPSDDESPGELTGAGGEVSCARGCCCRRGSLKLPKLRASERLPPAGSKRERSSEGARVTDGQTDAQTFSRHHRRQPIHPQSP